MSWITINEKDVGLARFDKDIRKKLRGYTDWII